MRRRGILLLSALAAAPAQADGVIGFSADAEREHYTQGTIDTAELILTPQLELTDAFTAYADLPWLWKQTDLRHPLILPIVRGRSQGSLNAGNGLSWNGPGDVSVGVTYLAPIPGSAWRVQAGLDAKFDNGDAGRALGSGTRDLTLSLDGRYRWRRLDLKGGIGHVRTTAPEYRDRYTFGGIGIAWRPDAPMDIALDWSNQQAIDGARVNQSAYDLTLVRHSGQNGAWNAGYRVYTGDRGRDLPDHAFSLGFTFDP